MPHVGQRSAGPVRVPSERPHEALTCVPHACPPRAEPEGLRPMPHPNTADRGPRAALRASPPGLGSGGGQPDVSTKPHPQGPAPCSSAELPVGSGRGGPCTGAPPGSSMPCPGSPQGPASKTISNQNRAQAAGAEGLGRSGSASPPVPAVPGAAPIVATACALVRPRALPPLISVVTTFLLVFARVFCPLP